MKPLVNPLFELEDRLNLNGPLLDGQIIGFLVDSSDGALKRSGLHTHPDCVVPLHDLLGSKATIYYPDPRLFTGENYKIALSNFSESLIQTSGFPFAIEELSLILMTFEEKKFTNIVVLILNKKTTCMWFQQVYDFVKDYINNSNHIKKEEPWLKCKIKEHAGSISIEVVKSCVALFVSKLI